MSEPNATPAAPALPKYPALSTEQKLLIRDLQINKIAIQEQAQAAVQEADEAIMNGIRKVAADLQIEFKNFDLRNLQFKD